MVVIQPATVGAVFQTYFDYAKSRLKTCDRERRKYRRYLAPLADRDALSLTRTEVESLRQDIAGATSSKTANGITELLSAAYNRAVASGILADFNPVRGLPKLTVDERNRTIEYDGFRTSSSSGRLPVSGTS
jgi:hypothetical protein